MHEPTHGPLLLVYAHPDDETFGSAGTMAAARAAGWPVTLLCATRGELGESGDLAIPDPDLLGAVREQELREACAAVGVDDIRFLGFRDSGMAGTPANEDPRALAQQPVALMADIIAVSLRALRPRIVVTFGPDGVYGHPDHLKMHEATVAAVGQAADPEWLPQVSAAWQLPALYFGSPPREEFRRMAEDPDSPLRGMSPRDWDRFGTPSDEITTWLDVSPWMDAKRRAMHAHRSQTGPGSPLQALTDPRIEARYARETFVRAPLHWDGSVGDPLADLIAAARSAQA